MLADSECRVLFVLTAALLCVSPLLLLPPQLTHNRKALLKYLLRIIALGSYSPTGNMAATRPQDEDAQLLFASLKVCCCAVHPFGIKRSTCLLSWLLWWRPAVCRAGGMVAQGHETRSTSTHQHSVPRGGACCCHLGLFC